MTRLNAALATCAAAVTAALLATGLATAAASDDAPAPAPSASASPTPSPTATPTPTPLPAITQPTPTVTGTLMVGFKLTAKQGTTTPTATRTYQWLRGGVPIAGATASSYTLKTADAGAKVSVKVTVAASGYETGAKASKAATVKARPSIAKASSLWVVVNKKRPLNPKSYKPTGLVKVSGVPGGSSRYLKKDAAAALKQMYKAAYAKGYTFSVSSGYRSYGTQRSLFNGYVNRYGRTAAERFSARPGYSEHQTGLTADLRYTSSCHLKKCAGATAAGKWVAKNGWKYGFIIRYPAGKESVTGYKYEPWHVRYVGKELAADMHARGITTLEEYFTLGKAPKY